MRRRNRVTKMRGVTTLSTLELGGQLLSLVLLLLLLHMVLLSIGYVLDLLEDIWLIFHLNSIWINNVTMALF